VSLHFLIHHDFYQLTNKSKQQYKVFINHIGFLCEARKEVIIENCPYTTFEIQDMSRVVKEELGEFENWETVYKGQLTKKNYPMGTYLKGDFSDLAQPGLYRVVLPGDKGRSYHFLITDGTFQSLIRMFLDFVHNWRSGDFENEFRQATHLDDAKRSDTGENIDASGGWYDAGDLRKWMTMSTLPVIGFLNVHDRMGLSWNHFSAENVTDNDLITESIWGLQFILKMQDPETGMIFEEAGAGGDARKHHGMTWWYENHSGCLADNSQNHFTDNVKNSGDERIIRTSYNPIVQYTNLAILLHASSSIEAYIPDFSQKCKEAAVRIWNFVDKKKDNDPLHLWTSVRSWRLCAGIWLYLHRIIDDSMITQIVSELLENWSRSFGFWYMDTNKKDPYRGILHSAQPIIGLAQYIQILQDHPKAILVREILEETWVKYINPMLLSNPYGMMPYGAYREKMTSLDKYHEFSNAMLFRYFMPDNSDQKINHGLGGHWTSWAHGLALCGKVLNNKDMTHAAWDQLYWLLGNNTLNACLVSGVGYNNPMPHSRFFGTHPGGFCVGPRGNKNDEAVIDLDARAEWSSTEYWLTPVSNTLMALSLLLPKTILKENKIGYQEHKKI
jgi:hypothetical protein